MWPFNLIPQQYLAAFRVSVAVVLAVACFVAGWKVEGWRWDASLTAQLEAEAKAKDTADKINRDLVAVAQAKDAEIETLHRRLNNEIAKNTSGRECFGAGAASVWNRAFGSLPADSTRVSRADPVPDAAGGATDEQVLRAGNEVAEILNKCRQRVENIRAWHEKQYGNP